MLKKRGVSKEYFGFLSSHRALIAVCTIVGTIVGAGILGIPYVVAKVGFLYGALIIVALGIAFLFLNLFVGEIVLRTKKQHQLPGYAEKYLGPWGKRVMMLITIISIYGALSAYLIGEGAILYSLFKIGTPLIFSILFFIILSFIVVRGIKATGRTELILILVLILIIVFGGFFSYQYIHLENFSGFNLSSTFLAYGVIIFAFLGVPGIPEAKEELGREKKKLKNVIIIASIIPIILYLIFTFVVLGIVGPGNFELLEPNQRIATIALSFYATPLLGIFANIVAILAMTTSYLTLGTALLESYTYDFNLGKTTAIILTFIFPLIITLFGISSFISILGITGIVAGGLEGTFVLMMYWRSKKLGDRRPEYQMGNNYLLGTALILLFIVGVVYQLSSYFF